jgi:predicted Ser/Thr protein kinase
MPVPLTCPQGHRWELPGDGAATTDWPVACPVCGAAVGAPAAGPAVPGYAIVAELGRGGMGVVYQAHHAKLDRLVAVKVLPAEVGREPAFAERFAREARALARLNHPHIVAVYDFGQAAGQSYFVMEYVEGANLRQRLRAGRLAPPEAVRLAAQVCDALAYAHEEGVVHRDIKPENILLDRKGRVKIADFGLAKLLARRTGEYTLTGTHQVMGTLHYMAPEQIENPQAIDHRADVYALGVVLYEMLTGGLPLGRFAPPSQRAAVDARVDAVVLRALEADPERRYQQVSELRADLDALGYGAALPRPPAAAVTEATRAGPPGPPPEATELGLGDAPLADPAVAAVRRRLRRSAYALLATGVLGLIVPLPTFLAFDAAGGPGGGFLTMIAVDLLFVVPLVSCLVVWGAVQLWKVGSYQGAVVGSIAALLPLSPVWLIGVWQGLGALLALREPGVKAAFAPAKSRAPGRVQRFLGTTTGWAIVCGVLGVGVCLQPWVPWAELQVIDNSGHGHTLAEMHGPDSWFGLVSTVIFLAVVLLLVATGFLEPAPVWRPLVLIGAGSVISLLVGVCIFQRGTPVDLGSSVAGGQQFPGRGTFTFQLPGYQFNPIDYSILIGRDGSAFEVVGRRGPITLPAEAAAYKSGLYSRLKVTPAAGAFAGEALGLALLVLGTLEVRGLLLKRRQTNGPE